MSSAELNASNMARVYISGPYSADLDRQIRQNIANASAYATRIAELGFAPLCPHSNVMNAGKLDYEQIMAVDFALLEVCEAIFMLPGWEKSPGAVRELAFAQGLEILVFFDLESLSSQLHYRRQHIPRVA